MSARHVRQPGQPRTSWAPLDGDRPKVAIPEFVPSAEQVQAVRNQFGSDLWTKTRDELGDDTAQKRLAPRQGSRR